MKNKIKSKRRTSFEMTVRIGDVRAEDDGIKKRTRRFLALVKFYLFSSALEHTFEERCSRTTARAVKYQYSFIPLAVLPSAIHHVASGLEGWDEHLLFSQPRIWGDKPLDRAFETLTRVCSIKKPRSQRIDRIANGLASSRPTGLNQTQFKKIR